MSLIPGVVHPSFLCWKGATEFNYDGDDAKVAVTLAWLAAHLIERKTKYYPNLSHLMGEDLKVFWDLVDGLFDKVKDRTALIGPVNMMVLAQLDVRATAYATKPLARLYPELQQLAKPADERSRMLFRVWLNDLGLP